MRLSFAILSPKINPMLVTKRQKEILDFVNRFIEKNGYAPSIGEIRGQFSINSPATVHQHLKNLQEKGLIKRVPNRHRSIEIVLSDPGVAGGIQVPILGAIAAGYPIESYPDTGTMQLSKEMGADENCYLLRVRGDSMVEDHILEGDLVLVKKTTFAKPGQTVVALIDGHEATLKKYFPENGKIRLQPANAQMQAMYFDPYQVRIQGVVSGIIRKFA